MKLDEEKMDIIAKADELTGFYSSTTEETHWLNEEEAYSLIESFVEILDTPLNDQINELNNKIDAQDKIINTQALEIARLKEENLEIARLRPLVDLLKEENNGVRKSFNDLQQKTDEAIESIKTIKQHYEELKKAPFEDSVFINNMLRQSFILSIESYLDLFLEILGGKENE